MYTYFAVRNMKSLHSNIYIVNSKLNEYREFPTFLNAIIRVLCILFYVYNEAFGGSRPSMLGVNPSMLEPFKIGPSIKNKINVCINIIDYFNNDKKIIIKDVNLIMLINKIYIISEILLHMHNSHFYADTVII